MDSVNKAYFLYFVYLKNIIHPQKITYFEAKQFCLFGHDYLRAFSPRWEKDNQHYNFLLYDEDTTFEDLNLEPEEFEDDTLGIIIKGNLDVGNIFNFETDYGIHLIVLGNLSANNVAVGGQDIYITGDLIVKELFMGSYNHGTMFVTGNVICPVIIIDDYSFCTMGNVEGTVYGNEGVYFIGRGEDELIYPEEEDRLKAILDDSVFSEYGIDFSIVSDKVANHQSFLRKDTVN